MNRWSPNAVLATQAIEVDPWDRKELTRATKNMRAYSRARNKLKKMAASGGDALADAFFVLAKANPQIVPATEMHPSHLVNRLVAREMLALPSTRRLREHTVGDPTQAALGCVQLGPMLETIFDRLAQERALAEELQEKLAVLLALRSDLADAEAAFDDLFGDGSDEDVEKAMQAAEDLRQARADADALEADLEARAQDLEDRLDGESPEVRATLRSGVGAAADDVSATASTARAWGMGDAELKRLPAAERLKLAKRLRTNRMRAIADLFGRIRNLSLSEMATTYDQTYDEIVDLELGGDLDRVVPAELLLLGDPETERDFLARWADGELMQYRVKGSDTLGRGGIVMCVDSSGSMSGARELWSKAVMLVLLHEARDQGRTMHVIHFGGTHNLRYCAFLKAADFTVERIIDATEAFFGGGTDFQPPMTKALDVLGEEYAATSATKADVVFATDDECDVHPAFMDHYLSEMRRMGARTYGIDLSGGRPSTTGALARMSEGKVASLTDLRSGSDIRALLRAVR